MTLNFTWHFTAVPLTGSSAGLPCQLSPSEPPKKLAAITKYPHVSTVTPVFQDIPNNRDPDVLLTPVVSSFPHED